MATSVDNKSEERRNKGHVKSVCDVMLKAAAIDDVKDVANDVTVSSSVLSSTACVRCGARVYPAERVSPALCLHKACFRCVSCDVTLTLHTYVIGGGGGGGGQGQGITTLYCQTHAPRAHRSATLNLHPEAIDIRNALRAQRICNGRAYNQQIRLGDMKDWELDANAVNFKHARRLKELKVTGRQATGANADDAEDNDSDDAADYERGQTVAKLMSGQLRRDSVRTVAKSLGDQGLLVDAEKRLQGGSCRQSSFKASISGRNVTSTSHDDVIAASVSTGLADVRGGGGGGRDGGGGRGGGGGNEKEEDENYFLNELLKKAEEDSQSMHLNRDYETDFDINDSPYESLNIQAERVLSRQTSSATNSSRSSRAVSRSVTSASSVASAPPALSDNWKLASSLASHLSQAASHIHRRPSTNSSIGDTSKQVGWRGESFSSRSPRSYVIDDLVTSQSALEARQRDEQLEVIGEFERARDELRVTLETEIRRQMEAAVNQLKGQLNGDEELRKVSARLEHQRDKELCARTQRLQKRQRQRLADVMDRQAYEMLSLLNQPAPDRLPPAAPPKMLKRQLLTDCRAFDDVDFYAMQVAGRTHASFTQLVHELVSHCRNDVEKVRSLFQWIALKDLNKMAFDDNIDEESPYLLLKGIKYGLESYHELFRRLCSYAGIAVKVIRGVSKCAGYRPSFTLDDTDRYGNSWTAAYVANDWRLIDCHWGARHVATDRHRPQARGGGACSYALDEFFFLTDPDKLIYMHLPDDDKWQLLAKPLSRDQFVRLPLVKSQFFLYGLSIDPDMTSQIDAANGRAEIVIKVPPDEPLSFKTRLEFKDTQLDGCCIFFHNQHEVIFSILLPETGIFFLTIFACLSQYEESFSSVFSLRINCPHLREKPFCRFPSLPDGYGLTQVGREVGLRSEDCDECYIVSNEGKVVLDLTFAVPVLVSHTLIEGQGETQCDRHAFPRYSSHTSASYVIRLPRRGVYVFSVFCARINKSATSLDTLQCACRFLIQSNCDASPANARPFPKSHVHWIDAKLREPISGDLQANRNVRFRLEMPKATSVAVRVGQQWTYLSVIDSDSGEWEGQVAMGTAHATTAVVCVSHQTSGKKRFLPLLEYNIIGDH